MPSWNAGQYLKFSEERTRPARDLAARIAVDAPRSIVDLGCGPGNSTAVLSDRWPATPIAGLDSSPAMIAEARRNYPAKTWSVADIADWADSSGPQFDIVFSNAALQWLPDHAAIFPRLFDRVASGGALAIQMPANFDSPAQRAIRAVAMSAAWASKLPGGGVRSWHVSDPGFYYDLFAPSAARLDIWETEYLQIMDNIDAIVEWYKGTGLRPFLDALSSDGDRDLFLADYRETLAHAYPAQSNGRVLLPFKRLFIIAYRAA
jgi:trans-aconitate 2-methyltransferase